MGANAQTSVPTFTAGEILTAANMNISARTGIPVFADSTARDAAFGGTGEKTLAEGQFAYLEDSNTTQYYDGATWQPVGASALTLIKRASFSNVATTTTTFDSVFTSTYKNYMVIIEQIYAATDSDDLHLLFRYGAVSQTAAYYSSSILSPSNTTVSNSNVSNGAQATLATDTGNSIIPSAGTIFFGNIGSGSSKPSLTGQLMSGVGTPTFFTFGAYQNTAQSYDGFLLKSSSTNITGTVSVYGLAIA